MGRGARLRLLVESLWLPRPVFAKRLSIKKPQGKFKKKRIFFFENPPGLPLEDLVRLYLNIQKSPLFPGGLKNKKNIFSFKGGDLGGDGVRG